LPFGGRTRIGSCLWSGRAARRGGASRPSPPGVRPPRTSTPPAPLGSGPW
jgi:hypothetical protein